MFLTARELEFVNCGQCILSDGAADYLLDSFEKLTISFSSMKCREINLLIEGSVFKVHFVSHLVVGAFNIIIK